MTALDPKNGIPGMGDVAPEDENAYLVNYGSHRVGITGAEVTQYYNKIADEYEEVSDNV